MAYTATLSSATTTNLKGTVPDYIVQAKALDHQNAGGGETYWYFSDAQENLGYYHSIPAVFTAVNALATWSVGRGYTSEDPLTRQDLEHIKGLGSDTFQTIMWNHEVVKVVCGDSFAEIVRKGNIIANLIPISPERVRLVIEDNQIKRYDVWDGVGEWKKVKKENMFHSSNKRLGDQIHGTSQLVAAKWLVKAWHEALEDTRVIQHRSKALGIAYYKTDNTGKISYINSQIEAAVKNGEMLGVPEEQLEIKDFPTKPTADRLAYIQYLENLFYQYFGVPRSIITSDGVSEVGGKMGHIVFEVVYAKESADLEADLWNQLFIKVTFTKPPSLGGLQPQLDESKNTGQINIQPNDVAATTQRE